MIPKSTKNLNRKYVSFQNDFNKGWNVTPIMVISLIVASILLIFLFLYTFIA